MVPAEEYFNLDQEGCATAGGGVSGASFHRASERPFEVRSLEDWTDWQIRLVLLSSSQNSHPSLLLSLPVPPTGLFLPSYPRSPPRGGLAAVRGQSHQRTSGADVQVSGGDQHPYPGETGPGGEGGPAGGAQE